MKKTLALIKFGCALIIGLLALPAAPALAAGGGGGGGGGTTTQVFDTTFATEYSRSCTTGCHGTNTVLMDGYNASYMTHVMVKCNACHGTHTAAEVGLAKPNLTGYVAGMGATGYKVPKDRCLACHSAAVNQSRIPGEGGRSDPRRLKPGSAGKPAASTGRS